MNTLAALFLAVSVQYHLPPNLLSSLCYVESHHNVNAIHHDDGLTDSLGICQIKWSTSRQFGFRGTPQQLMKPENNIKYAGAYLAHQLHRYHVTSKAVIAYNMGSAKNLTTSRYQRKVFNKWRMK